MSNAAENFAELEADVDQNLVLASARVSRAFEELRIATGIMERYGTDAALNAVTQARDVTLCAARKIRISRLRKSVKGTSPA